MRIVVIGGFAPSLVLFRAPLLSAMRARGHEVVALAPDGTPRIHDELTRLGVQFRSFGLQRAGRDPFADLRTLRELFETLRSVEPELVFTYTLKPVLYGQLAARMAGVPRRHAMLTGLGYAFQGQDDWRRRILRRGVAIGLRGALAGSDHLFLQNPDDLRDLDEADALPRTLATTIVRGSGVDLAYWRSAPWSAGPPTFLFVGRLLREKGIEDFVEMARRVRREHPSARFQVVGWVDPNPASVGCSTLDRWVAEGVVEYLGEVADVRPHLAACHVLVLPSYREGTPRSVLEAMAASRPVIVTDVPGCRETIEDGVHGLFVPPRDPKALARAAQRLLESPDETRAMGERARQRIETLYDANQVAASMVDTMGL